MATSRRPFIFIFTRPLFRRITLLIYVASCIFFLQRKYIQPSQQPFLSSNINNEVSLKNHSQPPKLDVAIYLSGELGNNLAKIAFGKVIELFALQERKFDCSLRFVSQGLIHSHKPRHELETCFSTHLSRDLVNLDEWIVWSSEWETIVQTQTSTIDQLYDMSKIDNRESTTTFHEKIVFHETSMDSIRSSINYVENIMLTLSNHSNKRNAFFQNYSLTLPFVIADQMAFMQHDYPLSLIHEVMNFFTFDFHKPECCKLIPDEDETVLHIRGFEIELEGLIYHERFRELDPTRTANELLAHLTAGDKVAVVSRYSETNMSHYLTALRKRGLRVRFVSDLTGIQTFCFLASASKEITGMELSTFFHWAALLNQRVDSVIMYCLNYTKRRCETNKSYRRDTWKTPVFQLQ